MKLPISCIAGILILISFPVFLGISILLFPEPVSPLENMLSDLGNSIKNPEGAIFFNLGCILGGIEIFFFYLGFSQFYLEDKKMKQFLQIIQILGLFSSFTLIMTGVYSQDKLIEHGFWSVTFFIVNIGVMIMGGIYYYKTPEAIKSIAIYGFIVCGINVFFILIAFISLVEWIYIISGLGYIELIVYEMFRKADKYL